MTDFTTTLTKAATAVAAVETIITNGAALYSKAVELIVKFEAAFAAVAASGATKKALVLAYLSVFATQVGLIWDEIKDKLSAFIDAVIAGYNAIVSTDGQTEATA